MIDLLNEITQTLRTNKLRTALTGFAVSWGIFLLIVLLSVARGVTNKSEEFFTSTGNDIMTISGGWTEKPYKGYDKFRQIELEDSDIPILGFRNSSELSELSPTISNRTTVSTSKDYTSDGYEGVGPEAIGFNGIKMLKGRFINSSDIKERRKVAVLSQRTANTVFDQGVDPIGQQVVMNELSFKVIGVYDHDWVHTVYIPYSVARNMSGGSNKINHLYARIHNISNLEQSDAAEANIRSTLANVHDFDPTDNSALWIWNRFSGYLRMQTASRGLNLAVWILGILTLISGIVGVSNIMFVSVKERTHEIGIRRAIGARPLSILRQVILESVTITTIFGYIGIVAGMGIAALLGSMFNGPDSPLLNPGIDISIAIQVTVVLILTGALAGLFPALKALKVKPVEALRDE
ncbi:MAG: ABC transporter permease [Lachnoclostridium sp.]|nr:ABC transporter permease [Lachnoclostridium sp.]